METDQKSVKPARKRSCTVTSAKGWKKKIMDLYRPTCPTKEIDKRAEIVQPTKKVQKKTVEPTQPCVCSEAKKPCSWEKLRKWLTGCWGDCPEK